MTQALTPRQSRFFLATDMPLLAGEQVRIGVAEQQLVTAALMVYLLPLLLLVGAALCASVAGLAEIWVILLSAVAAGVGFGIARRYDQRQNRSKPIHILAVLPTVAVNQA